MLASTLAALGYPLRRQIPINISRTLTTQDVNGILIVDSSAAPRTISLMDGDGIGAGGFFRIVAPFGTTNPVTLIFPAGNTYNEGKLGPIVLANNDDSILVVAGPGKTWIVFFGDASSASTTWAQTLANGNVSGGSNPVVEEGDRLYINETPIWGAYTQAELSAFGSADGLSLIDGAWAFDTTNQRWVSLTYLDVNSSKWFQPGLAYRDYVENFNTWTQVASNDNGYAQIFADGGTTSPFGALSTALADAAHPGVLICSITSAANSRAGVRESGGAAGGGIRLGAFPLTSEILARHDVKPSVVDRFEIYIGTMTDVGSLAAPTGGCFFVLSQTSGNWVARTRVASGVPTDIDTGVDGTINTWRRFKVIATTASAMFFIDDVLVATIATTLPTGQLYPASQWLFRTNGPEGGAVNLGSDYNYWRQDLR
jgi:hypothetical protein